MAAANLTQQEEMAIASFRRSNEFPIIKGLIERRLEKCKALLVWAKGDVFVTWQGHAQELEELKTIFERH